jgi:2-desacetyl-2-hydroxyethyl bacteriochlorophyllide A dehydrogenase
MKCIRIHEHGGVERLRFEEIQTPRVGADEVLVRVKATSINHLDLWVRQGLPGVRFPLPMIPGVDAAGVVAECGATVRHVQTGDRVVVAQGISCGHCFHCLNGNDNLCKDYELIGEHRDGADAEYLCVPSRNVIRLSEEISFESAAAVALVFLTAWQMLVDKGKVQPGDHVLVIGGSSGVGSAGIQIAKLFGAYVYATTSADVKADRLRQLGADEVIITSRQSIVQEVRRLTAKRGVDIVFEHVGKSVWDESIRSLTKGGKLVTCGATSGYDAVTDLRYIFYKQLQILGSTMGRKGDLLRILEFVRQGKLRPVIDRVLPFEEIREAHRIVEEGEHIGKVVITL